MLRNKVLVRKAAAVDADAARAIALQVTGQAQVGPKRAAAGTRLQALP